MFNQLETSLAVNLKGLIVVTAPEPASCFAMGLVWPAQYWHATVFVGS